MIHSSLNGLINSYTKKQEKEQVNINIKLPQDVKLIIDMLIVNGYKAYAVGGCIRDILLNKKPKDWDICTSATPDEIEKVFDGFKHILTGKRFGTVTVVVNGTNYEVTTFRSDGEYTDNRHPESVIFSTDLEEDLSRRDFTMNAMAYNEDDGLIDLFGGYDDIKNRTIKCVGSPIDRFNEDALRMLRAVRFSCVYHFEIEQNTYIAIDENVELLKNVSIERVTSEYTKMAESFYASHNTLTIAHKLLRTVIPETDLYLCKATNTLYSNIALTFYFHQHKIEDILRRMRFDNETIHIVKTILNGFDLFLKNYRQWTPFYMCKRILNIDDNREVICGVFDIVNVIISNDNILKYKGEMLDFYLDALDSVYSISQLNVSGNDLINIGYQGKEIGIVLDKLLDLVMREEVKNDKYALLFVAKHIFWNY